MSARRKRRRAVTVPPMSFENKDLAFVGGEVESKDLAAAVGTEQPPAFIAPDTLEVEMIHHYTFEGRNLLPGEVVALPGRLAWNLVVGNFAKYV